MKKSKLFQILLIGFFVIFLVSIFQTKSSFQGDLRNRIVGARMILESSDPYLVVSNNKFDERLIDPLTSPYTIVSRLTIPPSLTLLHIIVANLPYVYIMKIWFIVEWCIFFGTIFLLQDAKQPNKKYIWLLGLIYSASYLWQLHLQVGQIYILYTFLLALIYWLSIRQKSFLISGIVVSVAALLRPPIAIIMLPFLVYIRKTSIKSTYFTKSFIICFTALLTINYLSSYRLWNSYFKSIVFARTLFPLTNSARLFDPYDYYPHQIENVNFPNPGTEVSIKDSSIKGIIGKTTQIDLPNYILYMTFSLIVILFLFKIRLNKLYRFENLLLSGIVLLIICEFFIPAPRYSYYDIQMLVPNAILVSNNSLKPHYFSILSIVALMGFVFPILSSLLMVAIITLCLFNYQYNNKV